MQVYNVGDIVSLIFPMNKLENKWEITDISKNSIFVCLLNIYTKELTYKSIFNLHLISTKIQEERNLKIDNLIKSDDL